MGKKPIYAFIDVSNLFYGGVKSLGWKIDYKRLLKYLKEKYQVRKAFYFAGVEIYEFPCSILKNQLIDLEELLIFLQKKLDQSKKHLSEEEIALLKRNIQRTKFYLNLKIFGYILRLKPVKLYKDENGRIIKKANCDVDMTFEIMRLIDQCSGIVFLSGDGDFAPLLKYLLKKGKKVTVLARGERTAKEIRQITKGSFRDFHKLKNKIEFLK